MFANKRILHGILIEESSIAIYFLLHVRGSKKILSVRMMPTTFFNKYLGGFTEVGLSRRYSYTMTPWKTPIKSMGEWDYCTGLIPIFSSMKPGQLSLYPRQQWLRGGLFDAPKNQGRTIHETIHFSIWSHKCTFHINGKSFNYWIMVGYNKPKGVCIPV
jgi:hypothetical protein